MAKPWTVSKGVYTLIEDTKANREELAKELTDIINKKGTDSIKNIRFGKEKKPYRISTRSIEDVEIGTADSITFKSNKPRPRNRNRWGREQFDEGQQRYTGKVRDNMVDEFVKGSKVKPLGKIEGHHVRMLQMYSPFYEGLSEAEKVELSKFAVEYKFPLGDAKANIALLDEDFHKQIHAFMREKGYQLSTGKVAKGTPDLGNTFKSRKDALKHFFDNVQTPIENELSRIKWDQQAKYNPLSEAEFENQLNWLNSNEYAELKRSGKTKGEVTDLGKRLGGLDDTIVTEPHLFRNVVNSKLAKTLGNLTSKTRTADLVAQTATGVATGNVVQAGVAGGTLAATQVLQSPQVQKRVASQIADLVAKRGAKTAAKFMPGLDIVISGKESWDYLRQGKLDQAGIAALSGAIGWVPVIGDGASAALDLTNTGIDISRLDFNQQGSAKKKKIDTDIPEVPNRQALKTISRVL